MSFRRLWVAFGLVVVLSFAVLGWTGIRIYQSAPPVPDRVVTSDGVELIGPDDIHAGQNIWQSMGGMEVGSIWGHGSYVAPDWTADWLHREAVFILDKWSGSPDGYARLPRERQGELQSRLQDLIRTNTYRDGTVTVDPVRAEAFAANLAHYSDVFSSGREEYAIPAGAMTDRGNLRKLAAFFFWTSWAASTNRPDSTVTYTSNWPHEPLVGNRPTGDTVVWTGVSIILLSPASARWRPTTRRCAITSRFPKCRQTTRCSIRVRPPRSEPSSSTSGLSPRFFSFRSCSAS
jgi:nitric oxide reductase subunit B